VELYYKMNLQTGLRLKYHLSLFSYQTGPDGSIFPVCHIKDNVLQHEWDLVVRTKGEDVNFVRWYQSPKNNKLHSTLQHNM